MAPPARPKRTTVFFQLRDFGVGPVLINRLLAGPWATAGARASARAAGRNMVLKITVKNELTPRGTCGGRGEGEGGEPEKLAEREVECRLKFEAPVTLRGLCCRLDFNLDSIFDIPRVTLRGCFEYGVGSQSLLSRVWKSFAVCLAGSAPAN